VLELGGGLGSGAEALCDRLAVSQRSGSAVAYRFTELTIPFLRRAQRTLDGRWPGITFGFSRLDMDRPFAEAGVDPGSFSLVYAVNALHVANDLAFTLREIRGALQPGGTLVAGECLRPFPHQPIYVEFVFNLLEAFRHPHIVPAWRPNGGFLTPEQWTAALHAGGFREVRLVPDIAAIRCAYPSFVIAAIVARST
jgi:SAM-dependent methyltransferase